MFYLTAYNTGKKFLDILRQYTAQTNVCISISTGGVLECSADVELIFVVVVLNVVRVVGRRVEGGQIKHEPCNQWHADWFNNTISIFE